METYLVTGGAGFIGSNFVLMCRREKRARVVVLDSLTYAGNPENLAELRDDPDYVFVHGDIGDHGLAAGLLAEHRPSAVINFAAESHVDRSIYDPDAFVRTNVLGTTALLRAIRDHWSGLGSPDEGVMFLHVSTDEVFGSLGPEDPAFEETTPYAPNSPYAASKAAADHLVRAFHHTYGLPAIITNCSNNYGPRQFPEKLIPLMILNADEERPLPIYGDGLNVRDWLYVDDHCRALLRVLERGRAGRTYNIGGGCELTNNEVVRAICGVMDELRPKSPSRPHDRLIEYIKDRPGHDRRYAMNCGRIERELGWRPRESFFTGLRRTVRWYLENGAWVTSVRTGDYRTWLDKHYRTGGGE